MSATASFVVIGALAPPESPARADVAVVRYPDWESFAADGATPAGFLIALPDAGAVAQVAAALRSSPWWLRVACTLPGIPGSPLLDGEATLSEAIDRALKSEARRQTLNLPLEALEAEERLLAFLYLRDGARLLPVLDTGHRFLYRYPLVEAIAGSAAEVPGWLAGLVRRQLLEAQELVDRVRHCPACSSAHLLFVDVCPQCASIQIARTELLHCFACGTVAEESAFVTEAGVRCPNCRTALRHIGVDYDRPLSRNRCGACHHVFVDADVVARCLHCGTHTPPDKLEIREVGLLRLSTRGRVALRAGDIAESFAALETANYVVPAYFQHMLGWMLVTSKRHNELSFGLVRVEFLNLPEVLEAIGPSRAFMLLDEFARRLREILRTSDVTTRTAEDHLLMLLPFTAPERVAAKVDAFVKQIAKGREVALAVRLSQLACPRDVSPAETAERVLSLV